MPSYSDDYIRDRVKSGRDANRARTVDTLFAQATQPPHDDDAAAIAQLRGFAQDKGGWATNDAVNYTRLRLRELGPAAMQGLDAGGGYVEARDGGGFFGSVGNILKKAAPLAAFIPGVGPIAAGALAFGANSAGSLMKGEGFDFGGSLKDGLLSGTGAHLLGGQGINGISGVPGRLGLGGGGGATQVGNATQSMAGAAGGAGGAGAGFSPSGILGVLKDNAPLIIGGLGAYQSSKDMGRANDLRDDAVRSAQQAYAAREPFRTGAQNLIGQRPSTRPDFSGIFSDPGNPYNRVRTAA